MLGGGEQVTGNTIYNLDAMGEYETGPDDRPLYPPRITSAEVPPAWTPRRAARPAFHRQAGRGAHGPKD